MKIALISVFPPSMGSLNEYGYHLALGLAENPRVSEVVVIADELDTPPAELDLGPKISVKRVWKFNSVVAGAKILKALKANDIDGAVFNVQTASFGDKEIPAALGLLTPLVAHKMGITSGVLAHNIIDGIDLDQTILRGKPLRKALVKFAGRVVTKGMASASYITVTVQNYLDKLAQTASKADISLVPHGNFETKERDWKPQTTREKQIVAMGKFGTYKKLDRLISAFERLTTETEFADYKLVIGGTDHPNTPGYMAGLEDKHRANSSIEFKGYIPEDGVAGFFENARLAVFDYDATTGSSGVLHQVCSYGAVPVYPLIGEFVDLTVDEGIKGFDFQAGDVNSLVKALRTALACEDTLEEIALDNAKANQEISIADVASFHVDKITELNRSLNPASTDVVART